MKIDRHNYEEFFILYWDDELTAAQKQAVEDFVKENTDLQEEFKLLGDTRFTPDHNTQFNEKEYLLNDSFINITNYEEQLLNYIDDQLKADEKAEVEKFVTKYPDAQKELTLLQRTKLQPEAEIIFADKSVLYRREEKVRVISMTWFRVAVAAAIILIAGFATFKIVNTNNDNIGSVPPFIDGPKEKQPINKPVITITRPGDEKEKNKEQLTNANQKSIDTKKINKIPAEKDISQKPDIANVENKNNLPKPRIINDQNNTQEVLADNNNTPVIKKDRNAVQKTESGAINTSLPEKDVTNKADLALYIPEQEAKEKDKGGLKEFLRKTTRVFERRTKIQTTTDDNKLLLGAFAVSLK